MRMIGKGCSKRNLDEVRYGGNKYGIMRGSTWWKNFGVGIEVLERETEVSMGNSARVKVSCWIKDRNTDADEDDQNGNLVSWNNTCLVMYIWPDTWSRHKYPLCIRLADKN